MLTKKYYLFIALIFLPFLGFAKTYIAQPGDSLSRLAIEHYPELPLEGPNGSLAKLLELNPEIQDPALILIGQRIKLAKTHKSADEAEFDSEAPAIKDRPTTLDEKSGLTLEASYGGVYYYHSQQRTLGRFSFDETSFNQVALYASYQSDSLRAEIDFNSYEFSTQLGESDLKGRMNAFNGALFYRHYFVAISSEQYPLLREVTGETYEMVKEKILVPKIGFEGAFELGERRPLKFRLRPAVGYFAQTSADSGVSSERKSGLVLELRTRISREFFSRESYTLHYFWGNDLIYRDIERDITWEQEQAQGFVDTSITKISSHIGLSVKF